MYDSPYPKNKANVIWYSTEEIWSTGRPASGKNVVYCTRRTNSSWFQRRCHGHLCRVWYLWRFDEACSCCQWRRRRLVCRVWYLWWNGPPCTWQKARCNSIDQTSKRLRRLVFFDFSASAYICCWWILSSELGNNNGKRLGISLGPGLALGHARSMVRLVDPRQDLLSARNSEIHYIEKTLKWARETTLNNKMKKAPKCATSTNHDERGGKVMGCVVQEKKWAQIQTASKYF